MKVVTWPLLALIVAFNLVTTAMYSTRNSWFEVLPALLPTFLANVIVLLPISGLLIGDKEPAWLKNTWALLVSAFVLGLARELIFVALFDRMNESSFQKTPIEYALAGVTLVYFVASYSVVSSAIANYREAAHKFQHYRDELVEFVNSQESIINRENDYLKRKTQVAIEPSLLLIQKLLDSKSAKDQLVRQIEDVIQNAVRPLGKELFDFAAISDHLAISKELRLRKISSIPKLVNPRLVFNPTIAVLLFSPLYVFGAVATQGSDQFWIATSQILLNYLIALSVRFLLPNRDLGVIWAALLIPTVAVLSDLVTTGILWAMGVQNVDFVTLFLQTSGLGPIWYLVIAYLLLVRRNLTGAQQEADQLEKQLKNEVALLEQRIWVARRNWSYLLHGTVQSALTAALTRASGGPITDDVRKQIHGDLGRALEALANPPFADVDLESEIRDLHVTWQGIADLNFQISEPAQQALNKNAGLRFAANEILREAVSNAIRHGQSSQVLIDVRLDERTLHIDVANETENRFTKNPASLGSKMLDELTANWSLAKDHTDGRVHLRAELVIE